MDHRLSDGETAGSQSWQNNIQNMLTWEHMYTTRVCIESFAVYLADTWLMTWLHNNQVQWRHCCWPYCQRWWVGVQKRVWQLAPWWSTHDLGLNTKKSKKIVIHFRRTCYQHHLPLLINVKRVQNTKFPGLHLMEELTTRETTTAAFKKAQQCLYFLCRLKTVELPIPAMTLFYRGTIESILT